MDRVGERIFCGSKDLSKEDFCPKWLRRVLPERTPVNAHIVTTRRRGDHGPTKLEHGKLSRPGSPMSQTLRVVCLKCNNEWMSRIVERAKPALFELVSGRWPSLDRYGAMKLATWFTLYTIVVEFAHIPTVAVSKEERFAFREAALRLEEALSPPAGWIIYVGLYHQKAPGVNLRRNRDGDFWHRSAMLHYGSDDPSPDRAEKYNMQTTSLIIGSGLFQSIFLRNILNFDPIRHSYETAMRLIWPVPSVFDIGRADWPQGRALRPIISHGDVGYQIAVEKLWNNLGAPIDPNVRQFGLEGAASSVVPPKPRRRP